MKTRSFVCGARQHLRSFGVRLIVCIFIAGFFAVFAGGFEGFGVIAWMAAIGCGVWEFLSTVVIDVNSDGVIYRKSGKEPVRYSFADYYISTSSDGMSLIAEHRKSGKTEMLKCTSFDKATITDAATYIKSASSAYFLNRRSAPAEPAKDTTPAANLKRAAEAAAEAASDVSKRNPYSKNYAGNTAPKPKKIVTAVPVTPNLATPTTVTPKPTTSKLTTPKSTETVKTEPVKTESVKAKPVSDIPTLSKDIPADYNKLPEIGKISDEGYRSMPEITVPSFDEKLPDIDAAPKPSKHDHGEDFHKIVFYYPKRSITERIERSNALFVLWALFFAVLAFLGGYIALGALRTAVGDEIYIPGYVTMLLAGVIALVAVIVIAVRVVSGAAVTSRIFSKLEITEHHLVIDNVRCRFDKMSSMTMTAPAMASGRRHLSYRFDGKAFDYDLGPAVKPIGKRSDEFFTRYDDLWRELSVRGFRAV